MSGTTIRLSEEAKERLTLLKRKGESYEDVIMRLTETDKWAGFGVLGGAETDTSDGMERVRAEMQSGLDDDIGEDG
ncbi:DUF7557 family protein [Haloarcula rara]|uniref:DUF7557 family protein n=1 Tax=Haloarcula rara TaxID=3033387 RepID=UPI0023E7D00A|nr:antitoxin VapB family protein [Halomicroarcula sp. SHR3]